MAISKGRGRPKLTLPEKDTGTPELKAKRREGITLEPLDACTRAGILTDDEHRAGMHLRWLYTLTFGAPSVRSIEFDRTAGARSHVLHDDAWKAAREQDYREAVAGLAELGAKKLVMDICIFHRWPDFLLQKGRGYTERETFREGMRWLVRKWRR